MFYTYNLFNDALRLRDMFDNFFLDAKTGSRTDTDYPYVNLYSKDDNLVISALVPGVKAEDINVELAQDSLVIEGERKSDYEEKPYLRKERSFGRFTKKIKLPFAVDREKIKASLNEGILTISLEKSEEAKPKKIEVK